MKENRNLTPEEKLALIQLVGISNTIYDIKKNIGSYLKNSINKEKQNEKIDNPPVSESIDIQEETPLYSDAEKENFTINSNVSNVNIGDASIYDPKYLDIVKEDMTRQKPNTDERRTEIVNEPEEIITNEEPNISVNESYGYLTEEELFGDREPVKEVKTQVLEKKANPWEGLRTVTPGENN